MIDIELWLQATDDTERRRRDIQGFFRPDCAGSKAGTHTLRDLRAERENPDAPPLFQERCRHEEYGAVHRELMREARRAETRIIRDRYADLVGASQSSDPSKMVLSREDKATLNAAKVEITVQQAYHFVALLYLCESIHDLVHEANRVERNAYDEDPELTSDLLLEAYGLHLDRGDWRIDQRWTRTITEKIKTASAQVVALAQFFRKQETGRTRRKVDIAPD